MDNLKQTVNQYLDSHCDQSRPTVWGILHNTPCDNQYVARDLYKEWVLDKYKDDEENAVESENSEQESKSETESENQEVECQSDSE
jgi:alpha-D-ribose 1-methylphosphonate 5-triphosphate diphosphatase PhnM